MFLLRTETNTGQAAGYSLSGTDRATRKQTATTTTKWKMTIQKQTFFFGQRNVRLATFANPRQMSKMTYETQSKRIGRENTSR